MAGTRIRAQNTISMEEYRRLVGTTDIQKPSAPPVVPTIDIPKSPWPSGLLPRLMSLLYRVQLGNVRLSPEERLTIEIADELRRLSIAGSLRAAWTHIPHESALPSRLRIAGLIGAKKSAMGMVRGAADFVFLPGGFVELKADARQMRLDGKERDGQLSTNQRIFRDWCAACGAPYEVARSLRDVLDILRIWRVLT